MQSVLELEEAYKEAMEDEAFQKELNHYLKRMSEETPLYFAENMTEYCGGAKIYLKREDLNHTGAHKINNTIGQALLAVRMGKKKLSLKQGLDNTVLQQLRYVPSRFRVRHLYGRRRCETSKLNVFRMELLGAKVESVAAGSGTLKDAVNEALRYWVFTRA